MADDLPRRRRHPLRHHRSQADSCCEPIFFIRTSSTTSDCQATYDHAFDPAAWLATLTADGGTYALARDGRLWLGGFKTKAPVEIHATVLVGRPDRVDVIKIRAGALPDLLKA